MSSGPTDFWPRREGDVPGDGHIQEWHWVSRCHLQGISVPCYEAVKWFRTWLCVRVDVSEENASSSFLRQDHFLLSVSLFTKAKGLVWIEGPLSFTPPPVLGGPPPGPVFISVPWGEGWGRCGWAGEPRARGAPLWAGVCGAGWPSFPYTEAFIVKGQSDLGAGPYTRS